MLSMFADVVLYLTDPVVALPSLQTLLSEYGQLSGLTVNHIKSKALKVSLPAALVSSLKYLFPYTRQQPLPEHHPYSIHWGSIPLKLYPHTQKTDLPLERRRRPSITPVMMHQPKINGGLEIPHLTKYYQAAQVAVLSNFRVFAGLPPVDPSRRIRLHLSVHEKSVASNISWVVHD